MTVATLPSMPARVFAALPAAAAPPSPPAPAPSAATWHFGGSQNSHEGTAEDLLHALCMAKGFWCIRDGDLSYRFPCELVLTSFARERVLDMVLALPKPDSIAAYLLDGGVGNFEQHIHGLVRDAPKLSPESRAYAAAYMLCCTSYPSPLLRLRRTFVLIDTSNVTPKWRVLLQRRLDFAAARFRAIPSAEVQRAYASA
jgi:hypothetical protein